MAEDEDKNPEIENADGQEPEADFEPQAGKGGKGKAGKAGKAGKQPVTGKPAAPRSTFRAVDSREYEAGTVRKIEKGIVITDS